jgi:hypothetical protein
MQRGLGADTDVDTVQAVMEIVQGTEITVQILQVDGQDVEHNTFIQLVELILQKLRILILRHVGR